MRLLRVIASSDEYMAVDVFTPSDPTGETAPGVSVVAPGATHSSFTTGAWSGSYDSVKGKTVALLPSPVTLGLTAGRYAARVRVALGAESPVYEDLSLEVTD